MSLLAGMQSCQVKNKIGRAGQLSVDRMLFIPVASTGVLKDVTAKIYAIDSLKDNTAVEIKHLKLGFYNGQDTLLLRFEIVKVRFKGDTLKVDDLKFPEWDVRRSTDEMKCEVSFSFSTPAKPFARCMEASYVVNKGEINATNAPRLCP